MARRFRCPVCGTLAWSSTLDRYFPLETYNWKSLGKAHGFKPILVDDPFLIERVKAKILSLYHRLFPPVEASLLSMLDVALRKPFDVVIPTVSDVIIYPKIKK